MNWTRQHCKTICRGGTAVWVLMILVLAAGPVWAAGGDEEQQDGGEQQQDEEQAVEGPTPKMFLLPSDGVEGEISELVTERINDSVRDRMESLGGVDLLPTFEAMHGATGSDGAAAAVREAEQQYTSGIGSVNAGNYEAAVDTLAPAVDALKANVAELQNFNILTDAMARLAIAYFHTGYDLDARDNIQHFAQLEPDAELDPENYPEELRNLYNEEVDRIRRAEYGILHIGADTEGAQVYINGELRGETPLTIEDATFGEHFMVVRHGGRVWADLIQVRARGTEQDFDVDLRDTDDEEDTRDELPSFYVDLRENLRSGQFGQELEPYFNELVRQTGADYVGWSLVVPERGEYVVIPFVYRAEDSVMIEGEQVVFNSSLSNVRSRAIALSDIMATAVVYMPDNLIVESVDLLPDEELEPIAEEELDDEFLDEEAPEESERREMAAAEEGERPSEQLPVPSASESDEISDPGPIADGEGRSNTMRYLGWGGAAAAATGVVATTVFLLTRGSDAGPGFEAEVEW